MSEALIAIAAYLGEKGYKVEYIDRTEMATIPLRNGNATIAHFLGMMDRCVEVHFYGTLARIEEAGSILLIRPVDATELNKEVFDIHEPDSFQRIAKRIDKLIDQRAHDMARTNYIAGCDG